MMKACKCGSYAINHHCHGRDGSDDDLCDVCYWRKRAEQPAQHEPFTHYRHYDNGLQDWADEKTIPLYTSTPAQRTWVELTDREIDELWMSHHDDFGNPLSATGYERAIEAKLKEKNNG